MVCITYDQHCLGPLLKGTLLFLTEALKTMIWMTQNLHRYFTYDMHQTIATQYSLVHLGGQQDQNDLFVPVDRKTTIQMTAHYFDRKCHSIFCKCKSEIYSMQFGETALNKSMVLRPKSIPLTPRVEVISSFTKRM